MFALTLLASALAVNGIAIPRDTATNTTSASDPHSLAAWAGSNTTLTAIGCVANTDLANITSNTVSTKAEARESCATACLEEGGSEIAYFRADTQECYCTSADSYPSSGQIVYADDDLGNCRDEDDASVNYFVSPYTLEECYYTVNSNSTKTFNAPSPISCLTGCTSTGLTIRPELDQSSGEYVYECACYDEEVQGGQSTDCGFGVESVFTHV
ncbi:hypothetical protein L202_00096 [Cryptococcus amylolentus CBS 6039]|uniref:WSC domain-containing protein n=2 Tax=Cryptococcus amylolentus TaxID=104669 RepID=A0A1E3I6U1_9TREE|nr:hypothetical protein L202_00096 [Cryptococcus amylolentus CBS 6039]ODN84075.1 hypothetical protein L202_00096 [Cryptococcus amylolentus CBS 6039]ODO12051.1 hypothetical protein I350_00835 [Cryptococcus amylolentus CBS 6273]